MNKDIIQTINKLENLKFIGPVLLNDINRAEKELNIKFAEDYIQYVKKFGAISANGLELTGITKYERLSVVSVTQNEKKLNFNMPDNMYVIENVGINGILILQDSNGAVYSFIKNRNPIKIANSLAEYIESVM